MSFASPVVPLITRISPADVWRSGWPPSIVFDLLVDRSFNVIATRMLDARLTEWHKLRIVLLIAHID